jgi:hypothetical protein
MPSRLVNVLIFRRNIFLQLQGQILLCCLTLLTNWKGVTSHMIWNFISTTVGTSYLPSTKGFCLLEFWFNYFKLKWIQDCLDARESFENTYRHSCCEYNLYSYFVCFSSTQRISMPEIAYIYVRFRSRPLGLKGLKLIHVFLGRCDSGSVCSVD